MGIAAIIGIVSSVIQAVRAFNPPETAQTAQPQQKADKLFAELDAMGQGLIQRADLERAFDKIAGKATAGAENLFTKLDADGDGAITRSEFTSSIGRLADQLDQHFHRTRVQGEGGLPPVAEAGFTRDELSGQLSSIVGNFDKADANGDGRVSIGEAKEFARTNVGGSVRLLAGDNQNVELMLQVVRLMQAYGIVGGNAATAGNSAGQTVSDKV
jgi:hypothetical protein